MQTPSQPDTSILQAQWHVLKAHLRHQDEIDSESLWELKSFLKECIATAREIPHNDRSDLREIAEEVVRTLSIRITPTDYPAEMIAVLQAVLETDDSAGRIPFFLPFPLRPEYKPISPGALPDDTAPILRLERPQSRFLEWLLRHQDVNGQIGSRIGERQAQKDFSLCSTLKQRLRHKIDAVPEILKAHLRRWVVLGSGAALIGVGRFLFIHHGHRILAFPAAYRWPIILLALYVVSLVRQVVKAGPVLLHSPIEALRILDAPLLGYVPMIENEEAHRLSSSRIGGSVLNSYRKISNRIRAAAGEKPLRSLLITSTIFQEGKSTIAYNLAAAMASEGKKAILIDTVFHASALFENVDVTQEPGWTNVLVGHKTLEETLQQTPIPGMRVLPSGPKPPRLNALLQSQAMYQLVETLKEHADILIFDSPTCAFGAMGRIQTLQPDGVLYVLQQEGVKKAELEEAAVRLNQAQAPLLGIVYNKVALDHIRVDFRPMDLWRVANSDSPRTTADFEDLLFRSSAVKEEPPSAQKPPAARENG